MRCGKRLLTTSPNSHQPHGFVLGTIFLGSHLWVSRVEVFAALYGAFGKNCIGTGYVFMLLFDTPFPGLKQHYNSVWHDTTPNWIQGFKRQQFQCGEPWVKEARTIKLACGVKT